MIVDAHAGERIGAVWLRAALAPVGDFGRRSDQVFVPFGPGDEAAARAACAHVLALAHTLASDGVARVRAALRRAPDAQPLFARARAGDPLTDVDLYEVGRFIDALRETSDAWFDAGGAAADRPPTLEALGAILAPGRSGAGFYLADAFAAELAPLRARYADADERVQRERARLAMTFAPQLGFMPEGDEFIAMRDALPLVPAGMRVVRETPAYRTLALELDATALAAAHDLECALSELAEGEASARRALAERIGMHMSDVHAATAALGALDRTLARVAFTQRWDGCVPHFTTEHLAFDEATFAPLAEALAHEGLSYTRLSLDLRGVAVITGPNMGGKSAALATCGFLALCCAYGVPPPAQAFEGPLFAHVAWIGAGGSNDFTRLLSSFGAEVALASDALAIDERPELVLVDEFARTTGPREGRALTIALLEALVRRGAFALAATHFDGVARLANVAHVAIAGLGDRVLDVRAARNLHMALDAVARAMDYRIVKVEAGAPAPSDALALARLLGLEEAIVERAAALFAAGDAPTGG